MAITETNLIINFISSLTGLIGTMTGFFGIWITYLNYKRDSSNIKVRVFRNMKPFTPGMALSKETFVYINVANAGRRPVIINKAGYVCLKIRGGAIAASSMMMGSQELKEGKAIDYMMEEEGIDYSDINYFAVYDSVGNEYRHYIAPWYLRLLFWFLDVTYIKRKPLQAPKTQPKKIEKQ